MVVDGVTSPLMLMGDWGWGGTWEPRFPGGVVGALVYGCIELLISVKPNTRFLSLIF